MHVESSLCNSHVNATDDDDIRQGRMGGVICSGANTQHRLSIMIISHRLVAKMCLLCLHQRFSAIFPGCDWGVSTKLVRRVQGQSRRPW